MLYVPCELNKANNAQKNKQKKQRRGFAAASVITETPTGTKGPSEVGGNEASENQRDGEQHKR